MTDATNGAGRPLVSVVVPVYNEERTVAQVVDELLELNLRLEILLVDDGSTDGSAAELARLAATHSQVTVLSQPRNLGKGAAVRRGIDDSHGDILLIQDADLEYSPSDIPALIDPLLTGKADAVFGTRLRGGAHPQRAHLFWHYAGNRFLTLLSNVLYNTTISDMEVGYKAFKGDLVRGLAGDRGGVCHVTHCTGETLRRCDRGRAHPVAPEAAPRTGSRAGRSAGAATRWGCGPARRDPRRP